MEPTELKLFLNSGLSVFVAMLLVAPAIPSWRQNLLLFGGVFFFFFATNLYLSSLTDGVTAISVFRAVLVACIPLISGFVWSKFTAKYSGSKRR
jgi:hypothetical protein